MDRIYDMVILGGGPGGCSAALYAARAGLKVLVLEKLSAGGQMALTGQVDNYPGFPGGIDGFELGQRFREQAERFGAVMEYAQVEALDLRAEPKVLVTSRGNVYGRTVVLAMGADARKLGLENEDRLTGRGIHYCAHCDGMFYRDKTVAVVGGGNSAAGEALYLSRIAKRVILIHRRDTLRATRLYQDALQKQENVQLRLDSEVTQLLGGDRLSGLRLRSRTSGAEEDLAVDGVFVSIGREPATELVTGQLELDNGYIHADESTRTSLPGVFAVGDIRTKALRQILTAAADGACAAHEAEGYLAARQAE